jgi:hypothetical protein
MSLYRARIELSFVSKVPKRKRLDQKESPATEPGSPTVTRSPVVVARNLIAHQSGLTWQDRGDKKARRSNQVDVGRPDAPLDVPKRRSPALCGPGFHQTSAAVLGGAGVKLCRAITSTAAREECSKKKSPAMNRAGCS